MNGKRVLTAIIMCALVFTIHAACSKKEKAAVTFAVGGAPGEIEFWEKLVKEFTHQSGIEITLLRQPTDTDQRRQGLIIPLNSGKADPDVFLMDVAWISQIAASGWLDPLDRIAEEIGTEKFFERVITLADRHDGEIIALPVYVDGGLLYYRKDLLSRFGYDKPPETWNKLIEISLKIQENMRKEEREFYGFVWQGAQYEGLICNFIEFASSNRGGISISDNRISLNIPENVEALRVMREAIHTHAISPPNTYTEMKEEEVRAFFQKGKAIFERNWPYAWAMHQRKGSPVKDKIGIAPLPHFESGQSVSTLGGWHIGISRYSDEKKQARRFVKFVLSYETQKKLVTELGWNSGRTDIYTDGEILKKLPHYKELKGIFEVAMPRPVVPYYTQISAVIQRHVNGALSGKITPEWALDEAERESQIIINRYLRQ